MLCNVNPKSKLNYRSIKNQLRKTNTNLKKVTLNDVDIDWADFTVANLSNIGNIVT